LDLNDFVKKQDLFDDLISLFDFLWTFRIERALVLVLESILFDFAVFEFIGTKNEFFLFFFTNDNGFFLIIYEE
jgi:hypothetical protein